MQLECIASIDTQWGETPFYHQQKIWFIDSPRATLHCYDPQSGVCQSFELKQTLGCAIPCNDGRVLVAGSEGLGVFDPQNHGYKALANPLQEGLRFNDGKVAPDGELFIGTIDAKREPRAGLWHFTRDFAATQVYGEVANSNGIVWFEGQAFYADTARRRIMCFDYANGRLNNARVAFSTAHIDASPDGLAVDTQGNLWIAMCHGSAVVAFDRQGRQIAEIKLPCLEATACCFAGANMDELYITTGKHAKIEEPLAGKLFKVTNMPYRGLSFTPYAW